MINKMTEKFAHKKSLGQHFLNSDYTPKKMCDAAHLTTGDVVLEVGPGTGILTKEILARGARVIAIEADLRAIASLEDTFPDEIVRKQIVIHHHDARTLNPADFGVLDHQYKVVSNIPYYISGSLFRSFLDTDCQPTDLVFLVQKEVAHRIARDPKESLLSLSVKVFGSPSSVCTIKKGHFTPPPKVDSAIVAVSDINRDAFANIAREQLFALLHLGFGQKRKQLLGNLSKEYNRDTVSALFSELDIPQDVRAEDLSPHTWFEILQRL
jgi:16S rRNA (adenine1518-N6/adenine1519-N6)-dimethyltransferase